MTVKELANIAMGEVPRLSYPAALDQVKTAWEDVVSERGWTFLHQSGVLHAPGSVSSGAVAVTKFSATVTFDATGKAALNASVSGDGSRPVVGRQFRGADEGQVYTITAYDSGTGVATLDRVYLGTTAAALGTYNVYRAFYIPPAGADFTRWESVVDVDQGYPLALDQTTQEIDRIDPQRNTYGNPYRVAYRDRKDPNTPGAPRYELWPHPTLEAGFVCHYVSRGLTDHNGVAFPSDAFQFPLELPTMLLRERVLARACQWAEAHKGEHTELRGINWRFLWQQHDANYRIELVTAKKQDDAIGLPEFVTHRSTGATTPIDAAYAQSHAVDWIR